MRKQIRSERVPGNFAIIHLNLAGLTFVKFIVFIILGIKMGGVVT